MNEYSANIYADKRKHVFDFSFCFFFFQKFMLHETIVAVDTA